MSVKDSKQGMPLDHDQLNESERRKLDWLLGVYLGADSAQVAINRDKKEFALQHALVVERKFDWRIVQQRCLPELLVMLLGDGDHELYDYPVYAVVPRLSGYVELQTSRPRERVQRSESEDGLAPFNELERRIALLPEEKRSNAVRQLGILKRILGKVS